MAERYRTWRTERSESTENLNNENVEAEFSNVPPRGLFRRMRGDGINYAYEPSPDDVDGQLPSLSSGEANARADFMAIRRPPTYQRSISDGKESCILMSPLSSGNRRAASSSFIDETSRDIAEAMMADAKGENVNTSAIPAGPVLAPNSDEQRRNRVTITPFLDEYFRTRARAFVTDNPPPSDRVNLVDNEAQPDNQNPEENPQEEGGEAPQEEGGVPPQEDGCMGKYHKFTKKIINSYFMILIYLPLTVWSFYCIFEGLEYTGHCPATDTLPIIFVFLGLASLLASIARMFHILVRKFTAYPLVETIVQYFQLFMFLGYFFIYILELACFLLMDLQRLTEVCAIEYYNFSHWNTWFQLPILVVMILLHAPAAYRSKWYCGTTERS